MPPARLSGPCRAASRTAPRTAAAVTGLVLVVSALGGCASGASTAAPASTTRTYPVPGSALDLSVTAPSTWVAGSQDGVYFVRSGTPYGPQDVRPTVVVVPDDDPAGTVSDGAEAVEAYASDTFADWVTTDSGPTSLGTLDGAGVSGRHSTRGVDVVQESTVVDTGQAAGADDDHQAVVTVTYAPGDEDGAHDARSVAASLTVGG
ncbi:hypothetical protein [Cellulomonas sp. PhB143]|uniref:hypothetical protein n=1 Tax=Cellulomonas sp. PhB143 TaxID=2485186 RepID=UPI000FA6EE6E|nr:hypothetical protein [Cellulomonas sp. PhB143]ROS78795.1 hypothetical protein EDF32_0704 [Cellulomonas sp. PhB143]